MAPILAEPAALEEGCHLNRSSHSPRCWPARDPRCLRYAVESSEINPRLLDRCGIGIDIAEKLLVTAGDNPGRMRSEAGFAMLCGVAPLPASSGQTTRHRLNRGGDRGANSALHMATVCRKRLDPRTRAYVARRKTLSGAPNPLPHRGFPTSRWQCGGKGT